MNRPGALAVFRRLDLQVQRRLDGLLAGEHHGVRLGPGSEAEELTRYQPGDDVRRIDWNVTARADGVHVWRTRAEHAVDTWLLLDESASMAFGTAAAEKGELADHLAAAVGLLTDRPGNRLGILAFGASGLAWQRPVTGRTAARRAMLRSVVPPRAGVPPTDLAGAIDELRRRHRRPGLRVIVSDLLDPAGAIERPFAWEGPLRRLAVRHDVVVLEVLDPRELELPDVGHVVLVDPESGRRRDVATGEVRLRQRYAAAATAHRAELAKAVRSCGAAHVRLRTDGDWVTDLARAVRSRRAAGARRRRRVG